jgi:hypothetical protein
VADKYLYLPSSGVPSERELTVTSEGVADAGKGVALDGGGRLDTSVMPVGVGASTITVATSENLAAGDLVNLYSNAGTINARKADASAANAGKRAHGFVLAGVTAPANATVYIGQSSVNSGVSGLTVGSEYYLSSTAGGVTTTSPTTAGHLVQSVGVARSATELVFNPQIVAIRA